MVDVYENIRSDNGAIISGRTKLFIEQCDDDGTILKSKGGSLLTPEGTGTMFIVDDWLIEQLDKVRFIDGVLSVKDGEELISPVKSEKELRREALLKQLAELDSEVTQEEEEEELS